MMRRVSRYLSRFALMCAVAMPLAASATGVVPTPGDGWQQMNRQLDVANLWDMYTNRHYGGYNHALAWPGAWYDWGASDPADMRTTANYKGFVIGAVNVPEPQYPEVIWPYMVGQRDGRNDGEKGEAILSAPPDPLALEVDPLVQILFKGRLARRTFRQAYPTVTVDGVISPYLQHIDWSTLPPIIEPIGTDYEADAPYQDDVIDPAIPCDLQLETYSWSRMGISTNRMVYSFVDRDNDDAYFWHWRMINDGIWGRTGADKVRTDGQPHPRVEGVMQSLMVQWDRARARGPSLTNSTGEGRNDTIWNYYGTDYDGGRTEDMRLIWVRDGDQHFSKYAPDHDKLDDYGDPHPVTGELLSARDAGLLLLHYDRSATDRRDDPAQPRTVGWVNYRELIQTGPDGHEMKYNQMLLGVERSGEYYRGPYQSTTLRGLHPEGGSWIKASNDPATSGQFWPGKTLGVDIEVTDVEQQVAYGPNDMAAYDTLNAVFAVGVNGLDIETSQRIGGLWLAGQLSDAQKNEHVFSAKDSLFMTMRQAKAVHEAMDFGGRYASTRSEFEQALRASVGQGLLSLSPPAPATLTVNSGPRRGEISWTLNTATGSDIAGWRLYRAEGDYKGDAPWTMIADVPPGVLSCTDTDVEVGHSYYYYLTTYDAAGHESTMHTRTSDPMQPGDGPPPSSEVSGSITTTTWRKANAPYRVKGTVTVVAGNVLTIQPGVDVLFDADAQFIVRGALRAVGTRSDSVRFLRGYAAEWGGIRFYGGDSSSIAYARISDGHAAGGATAGRGGGVYLSDAGTRLGMDHSVVSENGAENNGGGVYVGSAAALTMHHCTVTRNNAVFGTPGLYFDSLSESDLVSCDVSRNIGAMSGLGGAMCLNAATVDLTDCILERNSVASGSGLYVHGNSIANLTGCAIRNNTAGDNGGGLEIQGTNTIVSLTRCTITGNSAADDGGAVKIWGGGSIALVNCTVSGNSAADGGGLHVASASVSLLNTILWGDASPEIYGDISAIAAIYCDIQGGYAGEGNIDADPRFIAPDVGNYRLQATSPCVDAGSPSGPLDPDSTTADMGPFYVHHVPQKNEPTMLAVRDIAGDQGGYVTVSWQASVLDTNVDEMPHYSLWRALPLGAAKAAGGRYRSSTAAGDEHVWEWLASPIAHRFRFYAQTVRTRSNRTLSAGATETFMVSAHTRHPDVFYDSDLASGFSTDDLAPAPPHMRPAAIGSDRIVISWRANVEPDLLRYAVYRSDDTRAALGPDEALSVTTDTVFVDSKPLPGMGYYFVAAEDVHGNMSAPSAGIAAMPTAVAEGRAPSSYVLKQNVPNPFNPITTIRFELPTGGRVVLIVCDTRGRVVRTLATGELRAGYHETVWDGRDSFGRDLAAGVYIYRLATEGGNIARRMLLLR